MENNQTDYTGKDLTSELENKHPATDSVFVPIISSVTSGSKYEVNHLKNLTKTQLIQFLSLGTSKTIPPIVVAKCLNMIFGEWKENPEIWKWRAKNYTLKSINSVLLEMSKSGTTTGIRTTTPEKLFNYLLTTFHPPRRHPIRKIYSDDIKRNEYGIYTKIANTKGGMEK